MLAAEIDAFHYVISAVDLCRGRGVFFFSYYFFTIIYA